MTGAATVIVKHPEREIRGMTLQHVAFLCPSCGLALEADVGAGSEKGAYYRAFWCAKEGRAVSLNVEERGFTGRCPSCASQLTLLADFPLDACPRCHAAQGVPKSPYKGTSVSREGGTGR